MDNAFKRVCKANNLSLSDLARRSGVSTGYLSKIANDKLLNPRAGVLVRIAKELDLPVEILVKVLHDESDEVPTTHTQAHNIEWFKETLESALNALESYDYPLLQQISIQMEAMDLPLAYNYIAWYEGFQLANQNRFESALMKFQSALNFRPGSDVEKRLKAKILMGIGCVHLAKGNFRPSLKMFRQSLLFSGEGQHAGLVYLNLGTLYRRHHLNALAVETYKLAIRNNDASIGILAFTGLGQVYLDQQDFCSARTALLQGYVLAKRTQGGKGKAELHCNLGKYYKETGNIDRAIRLFTLGLQHLVLAGEQRTKLYILTELADAYFRTNRYDMAEQVLGTLEIETHEDGDILLVGVYFITFSKNLMRDGQLTKAIVLLNRCYTLLCKVFPSPEIKTCCDLLADCYTSIKEPIQADFFKKESRRVKRLLAREET